MHDNIMVASSRDHPPMLATRRFAHWQLRFMRYVDTKPNGNTLRKCILQEKEAIHFLLTGIGDEIYLTIDACKTAHDIWIAIERLQGESLNKQDIYKPTNNKLRTSSNFRNKNVDTTSRYLNENQTGQFGNQRTVIVVEARETVEQADWLEDTDEEIDEQKLEAHDSFMEKIQEVLPVESGSDVEPLEKVQFDAKYNMFDNERHHSKQSESINDTHVVEKDDSNIIPDSSNMCANDNEADQNAEEYDDERVVLAN
nr:hypothetical protein [Tanacetum cinerariifolium]GEZ80922.1 hypothetical protein [Tanacetum cinerariifolium]GEZ87556.1 hypothetical protein [Tanacetum cinerariifolium]